MSGQSNTTTDRDTIKEWAETRNGKPSVVTNNGEETEILRIDFPGYSGGSLREISWEEWFEIFDKNNLALIYQEETKDGEQSNFNKLVSRENVNG